MTVWDQISALKKKYEADMANALAAANKHGFTQVTAWPHGTWIAKSKSGAGHTAQLRETSADALIAAMERVVAEADAKRKAQRK